MKAIVLAQYFPPDMGGGSTRASNVVKGLLGNGCEVTVVAAIPAFNVERTIAKLVLEAQKFVDVVLVCDGGSTDCTAEIAERMGADVIRHERNLGYGAAIKTLFTLARE